MPERNFKNWLAAYMEYTDFSEAPNAFHFWTGISTIAGALRRRVWIPQRHFEWVPNFYIVLVAPPGVVTKSTSLGIGTDLLTEIEGIHFGQQSGTWQALAESIANSTEFVPLTDQGIDGPLISMSCLTLAVSELGTFLDTDNPQLISLLVDLWDGRRQRWEHRTRTQETITIENPWVNLIAATTPSWLRKYFDKGMIEGGLTSRIIFVFGNEKRKLVTYPGDEIDEERYNYFRSRLIEDLQQISQLVGPYELTEEAKAWGREWYAEHWEGTRPSHLAEERFGGYMARKQTHIHKIAMVVAAAQRNELVVTLPDLITAEGVITALEQDMIQVFDSITSKESQRQTRDIAAMLKVNGEMAEREVWRRCMMGMNPTEFSHAIDSLVKAGYISLLNRPNAQTRKNELYYVPNVELQSLNLD